MRLIYFLNLAISSGDDEPSDKDKTYKPWQCAVSEESVGSVHLDRNGDEIVSNNSPVVPKATYQIICACTSESALIVNFLSQRKLNHVISDPDSNIEEVQDPSKKPQLKKRKLSGGKAKKGKYQRPQDGISFSVLIKSHFYLFTWHETVECKATRAQETPGWDVRLWDQHRISVRWRECTEKGSRGGCTEKQLNMPRTQKWHSLTLAWSSQDHRTREEAKEVAIQVQILSGVCNNFFEHHNQISVHSSNHRARTLPLGELVKPLMMKALSHPSEIWQCIRSRVSCQPKPILNLRQNPPIMVTPLRVWNWWRNSYLKGSEI